MAPPNGVSKEFEEDLARGQQLAYIRDLAFDLAEQLSARLIAEHHYTAAMGDGDWCDLHMLRSPHLREQVDKAVEFLRLRGRLEHNPAFLHLVRFRPAPAEANAEQPGEGEPA